MKKLLSIMLAAAMLVSIAVLPVYGITEDTELEYTSVKLYRGKSIKNYLYDADKKVTWSSTNKKVATVSKHGLIKAKSFGKCTVKATTEGYVFKCKVKVIPRKPDFDAKITAVTDKYSHPLVKVRIKNYSNRVLLVYPNATYRDYTTNKYAMKLSTDAVKIKAKKSKTLKFWDYNDELWNFAGRNDPDVFACIESSLRYKFKYDGKIRRGRTYWYTKTDKDTYRDSFLHKSVYGSGIPTRASLR